MKLQKIVLELLLIIVFMMVATVSYAQPEMSDDRTLSPYFLVKGDDTDVDELPLKSTWIDVNISGVIADVKVTQVYKNQGKRPLEAIYVFPGSTRAAVYGMKMTVGERTILAEIREREQARQEYSAAKQAGKSASLLEQHRPNVFQMNVANILPSDAVKVELRYTELLIPTDAVYEFVYPTVVGPRYVEEPAADTGPADLWTANPYQHQGEPPGYTFNIDVDIAAGLPIQDIICTSHKADIQYTGSAFATVRLDPSETYGGNRDFILKYRLAGNTIETGLLLFEGAKENFFLLMLQPPKKVSKSQIPPREYIFIVDVSGSMHGFPLNITKTLIKDLIGNLRPSDRFNVLLFAGGSQLMAERSLPATQANIIQAINIIERQRGGGGTRLLPALKRVLSLPKIEGFSRSVVIATDGYVAVEDEAFDLIRNNLDHANMFTFGIGSSVNRHLIEGMARVGMGEPFVITRPEEAIQKANRFRTLIESPVLTDVSVDFQGIDVYDVEPPSIPDVLAERPVIVFGKWRGKRQGTISLHGSTGDRTFFREVDVSSARPLKTNSALRYLWARHRVRLLSDYNRLKPQDERVEEVTRLGLSYNLLTAYTSFIAVDTRIRLQDGKAVTVKQPLPLPQGVSDYAVGQQSFARKGMAALTAAPSTTVFKSSVAKECLAYNDKEGGDSKSALDAATEGKTRMVMGDVSVTGALPVEIVKKELKKQLRLFNRCLGQIVRKQPNRNGKVVFKFTLDPQGHVAKVHKVESTIKDSMFDACMLKELKKMQFPAHKGRKNVIVTATFILNPN
jgi:Ca-activated chloride channel family protein